MLLLVMLSITNWPVALAAGTTYYVNSSSLTCSDAGPGTTTTAPLCTIGKGATLAHAGDTVAVIGGTYTGTAVNPTNTGASGSPITFTASPGVTISGGTDAFAISSRSYIVINGFTVTSTTGAGISASSSNNITISNNTVTGAGQRKKNFTAGGIALSGTTSSLVTHNTSDNNSDHGFYVSGGSANNTVSFNEASLNAEGWQRNANGINVTDTGSTGNILLGNIVHDNEDSGLQFYPGANNGVAVDNVSYNNGDHGIDNLNVTGGVLTGNTVYHNCTSGINVEGTSGNYTIENNIAVDNAVYPAYNGISCSRRTGNIGIYDSAPTGTIADYNLVNLTTSGDLYVWAGTAYSTITALHTATGQEAHGLQADPKWVNSAGWNLHLTEGSPAIDSANSGAPSEPVTDIEGNPRVDDPLTPNTGAGPRTYDDRGAYEFQPPPPAPTSLTAFPISSSQISLSWTGSTGATSYKIQRSSDGTNGWTQVGTSVITSFTDTSLSPSTKYFYRVLASNGLNDSVPSSVASTTTLAIPGLLRVTTSPALASQITVDGNIADTWGLNWLKLPPGSHTVCFSSVQGYTAPACQTVTVSVVVTTTVTGTFVQRGFLRVLTSPAVPSTISVDGVPMDDEGLWTDMPTGSHQVCFGLVPDFTPPACQTATVSAGATTTITGTFTSSPGAGGQTNVGLLRVTSSPAVASQITVDGNIADTWGLNWLEMAPGSHAVCFSSVQGYTTPACQTVTVTAGATTTVTGTFVQRGFLQVQTSPAVAGTIFVNGIPRDDWGMWTDFPTGSYQVCFGVAPGYANTPACQSAVVTAGSTTTITGTYS